MSNTHKIEDITPQIGYVIVKPAEKENEVAGIIMPKGDEEVPQWGKVIKAAPMKNGDTAPHGKLEPGQTVIYRKWGGNEVVVGEKKYYFLKYDEIIGAVNV